MPAEEHVLVVLGARNPPQRAVYEARNVAVATLIALLDVYRIGPGLKMRRPAAQVGGKQPTVPVVPKEVSPPRHQRALRAALAAKHAVDVTVMRGTRKHVQQYRNSLVRRENVALPRHNLLWKPKTGGELLNFSRLEAKVVVEVTIAGVVAPGAPWIRVVRLARLLHRCSNAARSEPHPPAGNAHNLRQEPRVPYSQHNRGRGQRSSEKHARACHLPQIVVIPNTARPAAPARHAGGRLDAARPRLHAQRVRNPLNTALSRATK